MRRLLNRAWIDPRYALAAVALAALSATLGVLAGFYDTFPLDVAMMGRAQALGDRYEPVGNLLNEQNGPIALFMFTAGAVVLLVRRRPDAALIFLLAAGLRPYLNELKDLVNRPRPSGDFAVLDVVFDSSFPSGHVMTAVVFFGLWFMLAPDIVPRRFVLPVRVAAAVMMALFGFSRMWAGVHWFSDVYGGVLWASMLLAALMALRPALGEVCERAAASWRERTAQPSSSR